MHLLLELLVELAMVEIGMQENTVESPDDGLEVLYFRDCHSVSV